MKRSTSVLLAAGIIATSSFAHHVTSASGNGVDTSCWDQYNLRGSTLVSTLVPAGVARKDCTPGVGCWFAYRASDGRRTSWFVPHGKKPIAACSSSTAAPAPVPMAPAPTAPPAPAPTTATPAPTTVAPSPSVVPATGQFVETFTGNTGFERFDYGIYHRDEANLGAWPGAATWAGDHDANCGTPNTQRTIHRDRKNESFYMCRDHLMTSIGDTAGYSTGWFSPKQTFTNATQVSWDAGITDLGGRQWWEVSLMPASFNSGVPTCPHCSVTDWLSPSPSGLPAYPAGSVVVGIGPDVNVSTNGVNRNVAQHTSRCSFDPEGCASKAIRRPFSMTDNRNGTITVNYGGVRTFTVPGSFPAGGFVVVFKDHNYTPDKDGAVAGYTWHWDNIIVR